MSWAYGVIVLLVVGFVLWRVFVASYRGAALAVSIAAMLVLVGAGIARGAGASGWWTLVGLVLGGGLFIAADRMRGGHAATS